MVNEGSTKPTYSELERMKISKHHEPPQSTDSASGDNSPKAATETRKDTPFVAEQAVRELEAAGWKKWKGMRNVWLAPWGAMFYGPYKAWKIMRGEA